MIYNLPNVNFSDDEWIYILLNCLQGWTEILLSCTNDYDVK